MQQGFRRAALAAAVTTALVAPALHASSTPLGPVFALSPPAEQASGPWLQGLTVTGNTFLPLWFDIGSNGGGMTRLMTQRVGFDGSLSGSETSITGPFSTGAWDTDGDTTASAYTIGSGKLHDSVYEQITDSSGNPTAGPTLVNTTLLSGTNPTYGNVGQQVIARDSEGDFVVGWTDQNIDNLFCAPYGTCNGRTYSAIYARAFNANGTPKTATIAVAPGRWTSEKGQLAATLKYPAVSVSINSSGNFAVAVSDSMMGGQYAPPFVQVFTAAGKKSGKAITWAPAPAPALLSFNEMTLADNGEVVASWSVISGGQQQSHLQAYNASGTALGEAAASASIGPYFHLTADPAGDYAAAYSDSSSGTPVAMVQRFAASGTAQGPALQPGDGSASYTPDYTGFWLKLNASGELMVAWTHDDGFDDSGNFLAGIFGRLYSAP